MTGMKSLDLSAIGEGPITSEAPAKPAEVPARASGKVFSAKDLAKPSAKAVQASQLSSFPSREPKAPADRRRKERVQKAQINSYMDEDDAETFKDLCARERYSYGDMITIMMRAYLEGSK